MKPGNFVMIHFFFFLATPEPTAEPTTEPTTEPTAEPTTEPTAEPTTEPTAETSHGNRKLLFFKKFSE